MLQAVGPIIKFITFDLQVDYGSAGKMHFTFFYKKFIAICIGEIRNKGGIKIYLKTICELHIQCKNLNNHETL